MKMHVKIMTWLSLCWLGGGTMYSSIAIWGGAVLFLLYHSAKLPYKYLFPSALVLLGQPASVRILVSVRRPESWALAHFLATSDSSAVLMRPTQPWSTAACGHYVNLIGSAFLKLVQDVRMKVLFNNRNVHSFAYTVVAGGGFSGCMSQASVL